VVGEYSDPIIKQCCSREYMTSMSTQLHSTEHVTKLIVLLAKLLRRNTQQWRYFTFN